MTNVALVHNEAVKGVAVPTPVHVLEARKLCAQVVQETQKMYLSPSLASKRPCMASPRVQEANVLCQNIASSTRDDLSFCIRQMAISASPLSMCSDAHVPAWQRRAGVLAQQYQRCLEELTMMEKEVDSLEEGMCTDAIMTALVYKTEQIDWLEHQLCLFLDQQIQGESPQTTDEMSEDGGGDGCHPPPCEGEEESIICAPKGPMIPHVWKDETARKVARERRLTAMREALRIHRQSTAESVPHRHQRKNKNTLVVSGKASVTPPRVNYAVMGSDDGATPQVTLRAKRLLQKLERDRF